VQQKFHDRDVRPVTDQSVSLQRLLTSMGASTREALWAVQLIERRAAVARWRSGQSGQTGGRASLAGTERPR
jgi:hypothetical protein